MNSAPQYVRDRAIKRASRELVASLGGQEAAADLIDKSQSHVQRCCSLNDETAFFNARDVGILEQCAPRPLITIELAKQAGGTFLALPDPSLDDEAIALKVMEIAEQLGDVSAGVRKALRDGVVNRDEAAGIELEIDDVIEAALAARAVVQLMQGKEPSGVTPLHKHDGSRRFVNVG